MSDQDRALLAPYIISVATLMATLAAVWGGAPRTIMIWSAIAGMAVSLVVIIRRRRVIFPSWEHLDAYRQMRYQHNKGLFLVHSYNTPSSSADARQVADVILWLEEHGTEYMLDKVDYVEYVFGDKFTSPARVTKDRSSSFETTDSLYGPLLVIARVTFRDQADKPLLLERYINFTPASHQLSPPPSEH